MPFDREKMKVWDKKWLLIDGRFICFNPDDQTMQSNLVERGAKVLMGFRELYSHLYSLYLCNFVISYQAFHLMPVHAFELDLKIKNSLLQDITHINKRRHTDRLD